MTSMGQDDASAQIQQMMNFILNEAKDKAEELNAKGMEEFSIEKFRLVNQQKEKIRQEFSRKAKQVETQCAIARSLAINKSRLEKIKARQEMLSKITTDVRSQLSTKLSSQADTKALVTKLIVQGTLMLLEEQVTIRCRKEDEALVKSCIQEASSSYTAAVKDQTAVKDQAGVNKQVKYVMDPQPLPSGCLGGVTLTCMDGAIVIDNTLDARLDLVMEQDKPKIRSLLFPTK